MAGVNQEWFKRYPPAADGGGRYRRYRVERRLNLVLKRWSGPRGDPEGCQAKIKPPPVSTREVKSAPGIAENCEFSLGEDRLSPRAKDAATAAAPGSEGRTGPPEAKTFPLCWPIWVKLSACGVSQSSKAFPPVSSAMSVVDCPGDNRFLKGYMRPRKTTTSLPRRIRTGSSQRHATPPSLHPRRLE